MVTQGNQLDGVTCEINLETKTFDFEGQQNAEFPKNENLNGKTNFYSKGNKICYRYKVENHIYVHQVLM